MATVPNCLEFQAMQGLGQLQGLGGLLGGSSTNIPQLQLQQLLQRPVYEHCEYGTTNNYISPRKTRKFTRINEKVSLAEGEMMKEPLDELRIVIAQWLD